MPYGSAAVKPNYVGASVKHRETVSVGDNLQKDAKVGSTATEVVARCCGFSNNGTIQQGQESFTCDEMQSLVEDPVLKNM